MTYTYTGDGLRASRTVAGSTTTFLWDRTTGLPELVDDGATITVQSPIGALADVDAATGDGRYPLHDGLGTARVQTDDAGAVTGTADYDAYGNLRASSGSQSSEGWAGETRDATTGLTHLRARDYDPLTGRFTTADTVSPNGAATQGYNAYHYTGNNPATRTDPSGHSWLTGMADTFRVLGEIVVRLVETLRTVMRADALPVWAKKFVAALIVFGLQILMTVIVTLAVVVAMEVTGAGKFMVGRALVLSRLHTLGKMSQFTARCMGNQLCRRMGQWLTQNADCALGVISTFASYGTTGAPSVTTMTGATTVGLDAASVGIDCFDKIPGTKLSVVETPSGIGTFRYGQSTREVKFRDKTVHQYDDLIDPNRVNEHGVTSLELMKQGYAPIGPDGKKIILHHHLQQDAGPMHEVPGSFHETLGGSGTALHPKPRGAPSEINRSAGRTWRENYWMQRACDFGGC